MHDKKNLDEYDLIIRFWRFRFDFYGHSGVCAFVGAASFSLKTVLVHIDFIANTLLQIYEYYRNCKTIYPLNTEYRFTKHIFET